MEILPYYLFTQRYNKTHEPKRNLSNLLDRTTDG